MTQAPWRHKMVRRLFALGTGVLCLMSTIQSSSAQTFDFDEGLSVLTEGLISVKREVLLNKKIAVFGIIESQSGKPWEISSHIEDGIVDVLVNQGYTVIERRRVEDIIQKELKKKADLWFDETQVAEFGKLVGADIVVTGRYVKWGKNMLRISARAINVRDGKVLAANKVKIHTDRITELLKPVEEIAGEKGDSTGVKGRPAEPAETKTFDLPKPQGQQEAPLPDEGTRPSLPSGPQTGSFCCDQFGNRRCALIQPFTLGAPCFCVGQGYGYTCQ